MKIAVVGLGRMGQAVVYRLLQGGYAVTGFDLSPDACTAVVAMGATIAPELNDVARDNRVIWLMVPAGKPVDDTIASLMPQLKKGDILIDGGNSHFADSIRRAKLCDMHGVFFVDCGTSGGVNGKDNGFSLMVGGDKKAYTSIEPALRVLAAPGGMGYVGPSGAGHYVKMIHNGIEYGMMQAYAEGFALIKEGSFKKEQLDLAEISRIWQHGAVIRSWLLELAHDIFKHDQELKDISGQVAQLGTGQWTVDEAHNNKIPAPVIAVAVQTRTWSAESGGNYMTKVIALLRNKFGAHAVKKVSEKQ
ncbi:6-phosphogluconate dehydrogenase (decarboxylating) [Candidatus Dependentiae bacterium HGW-Dependentiae-1]|nr:MAG: 6-phosphogluconate dehydrogenase (decarboxylating) [Candidatus Dependentiae bacterium HGW-Dependentiae-1]